LRPADRRQAVESPGGLAASKIAERLVPGERAQVTNQQRRRVVVTGIGLISPIGIGTESTWEAARAGRSGIGPITLFDASRHAARFAGEVKGFDPLHWIERKELKKCGRFIQFAIAAADMAFGASGFRITPDNAARVGVAIGSGIGGFEVIEREHQTLLERGPDRVSPFFILSAIVNLAAGQVSVRLGAKGPNSAVATACTTGAHAIGDAFRLVQHGYADAMICGGTEASITSLGIAGFAAMRALSTRNDEPTRASRPWDADRDGFVVGEGAGVLVVEERDGALDRGAPILAEIVGYGMSADAHHPTAPPEDGDGVARVMTSALADAALAPDAIGYLNAHATSTPLGDRAEAAAIVRVFGAQARRLLVSSTKSMTGHLLGGAGALEAGLTVLALRDQVAPPTINLDNPDEGCNLNYVPHTAQERPIDCVISNSFGFGGTNGSLLFAKPD
jgi:3-oxoacyl-[acyl-carrier-protein] synthase II